MKIGVLTSSRADYGIYQPLLRRLNKDSFFELELIVFGTHWSRLHGYTVEKIIADEFTIAHKVESMPAGDSKEAIASAMGLTTAKFSRLWARVEDKYDLIFCLGDRYEMFAAVSAGIPFNLRFAHIHGGEETLGAIDNIFRHAISHMAEYHFTTTETYKNRVLELLGTGKPAKAKVFNVGSLSLDNLQDIELFDESAFSEAFGIDLTRPTILFTFHPETVAPETNAEQIEEITHALKKLTAGYQIVITMPNADTKGNVIRERLQAFKTGHPEDVEIVESFGTQGYFSCMNHASLVMGNSSSGIIEAASFGKYVVDLGDRQKGRVAGKNVMHVKIDKEAIIAAVRQIEKKPSLPKNNKNNMYWNGGAADQIVDILKENWG